MKRLYPLFKVSYFFFYLFTFKQSYSQTNFWHQTELTKPVYAFTINSMYEIFTATPDGVYCSMDNGLTWSQMNVGLTFTSVNILIFTPDGYLFAGTAGGGVFRSVCSTTLDPITLSSEFILEQNYPNPFNDFTLVRFDLPEDCHVTIKLFNSLGQQVFNDLLGKRYAGKNIYHFKASELPSGIYYYQLQADDFVKTRKMVVVH